MRIDRTVTGCFVRGLEQRRMLQRLIRVLSQPELLTGVLLLMLTRANLLRNRLSLRARTSMREKREELLG